MKEAETLKIKRKVRKGDKVIAIAGNSRGLTGIVLSCAGERVVVQGLNIRKRHTKGQNNQPGSIIEREMSIHISNLQVCTADNKPIKLKVRLTEDGEREFYYKDGAQNVRYRSVKTS